MVEITIAGDKAVFEVKGSHKLWSLRSRLEVPAPAARRGHDGFAGVFHR